MRLFLHGTERLLVDRHNTFVPAAGAIVWLRHRPWKVLSTIGGGSDPVLSVFVEPHDGKEPL